MTVDITTAKRQERAGGAGGRRCWPSPLAGTRSRSSARVTPRRLVPVTLGLFDDTAGLVQVTGNLTPGERVVVPNHMSAVFGRPVLELDRRLYPGSPPVRALDQVSLAVAAGELTGHRGPVRVGQDHAAAPDGHPGQADHRDGAGHRAGCGAAEGPGAVGAARASRIGFVFQQFFLAEHQNVLDNVADGLLYAGVRRAERRAAGRRRAGRVGLATGRPPARPSCPAGNASGSRSPARSSASPPIVLADEPTGNLDSATGASILALLEELNAAGHHDHRDHPRPRHRRPDAAPDRDARRAHHHRHQPASRPVAASRTAGPRGRSPMTATTGRAPAAPPAARLRPADLAAAGQHRAAHPQAARRAVGAGHRDRRRRDRRRARPVPLLSGRAAGRDQPAGHQPAHRHQRADPHRRHRRAARRRPA